MRKILFTTMSIIFLFGVLHIASTPIAYGFTLDALWFVGSGISLVFLSFITYLIVVTEKQRFFYLIGQMANIIGVVLTGLILWIVLAPHVLFLFFVLCIQTITFLIYQRTRSRV